MTILYMLCICQLAIAQTKNFQGVVKMQKATHYQELQYWKLAPVMEFQQILTEYLR